MAKQEVTPQGISLKEHEDRIGQARKADQDLIAFIEKERDENIAALAKQIQTLKTEVDKLDNIIGQKDQEILALNSQLEDKNSLISELELELSDIAEKAKEA
jgi:uncharacterized protein (DUF3084 family)